jgi:hypothetical protein
MISKFKILSTSNLLPRKITYPRGGIVHNTPIRNENNNNVANDLFEFSHRNNELNGARM